MADMDDSPGETREDIPLKTGTKNGNLCSCCEDCFGSAKCLSFGIISSFITFALLFQIYNGDYQVVPHGSVASDSRECSEIGSSILKQGGNAADAAIATAFCLAVVNPHVTGLDSEGQFMFYGHKSKLLPDVIDFRQNPNNRINEPLPRMVIGLAYIHQQYSLLSWKQLIQPSVDLAKKGFLVPKALVSAIKKANIQNLFSNLEPGQIITMIKLSETLQNIADIPEEDLISFITLENTPLKTVSLSGRFQDYNVYVPNSPSIGPDLLKILQMIDQHNFTTLDTVKPEYYYRLAEITKEIYTERNITTNFHEGTSSNVAVIDKDDNYVSLVTGLYQAFGSQEINSEGYIMDVRARGTTQCSRVPLIITDADFICGRRMVLGSSNIASASQIVPALLIAAQNATVGIEFPRFNLLPDGTIGFEDEHTPLFNDEVIQYLETLGHPVHMKFPYSSCNIVEKVGDNLNSHSDSRGGGIASRFR
ncbi:PREDICTED: gamma-glutamyltransferase 7-like [Nicrophorus vespilloides]|uniref:Gamma-glutamyltransferase 7-like n=1 Tax=Nicrophorus vespilloides TaxID=110193 RepID=A0ABM1NII9_NICVS|nr:PREDICTED: gamma-glutamyltransferase 7-like [Nicrophorus vespilloides]